MSNLKAKSKTSKNRKEEKNYKDKILTLFVGISLLLGFFNLYQINVLNNIGYKQNPNSDSTITQTLSKLKDLIPTGIPLAYGYELNFSYDDIDPNDQKKADMTINKLAQLDKEITLTDEQKERYINILYRNHGGISCEFCCGARSVIFENGEPACGCAHSYAMRGLTKYLLTNHPNMSDEEILTEIGKLKVLFFPGIHKGKAKIMAELGMPLDYISLTTNTNRGIEKGQSSGGMVGGC